MIGIGLEFDTKLIVLLNFLEADEILGSVREDPGSK
jgi:hypothetical protein